MNVIEINPLAAQGSHTTLSQYLAVALSFTLATIWVIVAFRTKYVFPPGTSVFKRLAWPIFLVPIMFSKKKQHFVWKPEVFLADEHKFRWLYFFFHLLISHYKPKTINKMQKGKWIPKFCYVPWWANLFTKRKNWWPIPLNFFPAFSNIDMLTRDRHNSLTQSDCHDHEQVSKQLGCHVQSCLLWNDRAFSSSFSRLALGSHLCLCHSVISYLPSQKRSSWFLIYLTCRLRNCR